MENKLLDRHDLTYNSVNTWALAPKDIINLQSGYSRKPLPSYAAANIHENKRHVGAALGIDGGSYRRLTVVFASKGWELADTIFLQVALSEMNNNTHSKLLQTNELL